MYTPVASSVVLTYTSQTRQDSGEVCAGLTLDYTSCNFTATQQDKYNFTITLNNLIGSAVASAYVDGKAVLKICITII